MSYLQQPIFKRIWTYKALETSASFLLAIWTPKIQVELASLIICGDIKKTIYEVLSRELQSVSYIYSEPISIKWVNRSQIKVDTIYKIVGDLLSCFSIN